MFLVRPSGGSSLLSNRFQFVSASGSNSKLSKLDYEVPTGVGARPNNKNNDDDDNNNDNAGNL